MHSWEEGQGFSLNLYLSLHRLWESSFKVTWTCVQSGIVAKDYRKQITNYSR